MARLKDKYKDEVAPQLRERFGYSNPMQVPKVTRVTLNMGVGEAKTNAKLLDDAVAELTLISGQKPVITRARKSIAGFKVREGMSIGAKVTLRGERMYEMIDRLVSIALPRIRDFRGIDPKQFDGHGNFAMGMREQTIFPEIDYDKVERTQGLNVVITTTAKTDEEGRALLAGLGMPFRES
ncbi:MAG TPA: 50S ribosomal protein L5 [Thermoleophilia bacterium]|nr:50S ribosomal protein L5 [Thermoleophilia bacterium]